jgi:hypothetical protein
LVLMILCSSSVPSSSFTFGPVVMLRMIFSSPSAGLSLYLAAIFFHDGPDLVLAGAWHLVHLFSSSCASALPASARRGPCSFPR